MGNLVYIDDCVTDSFPFALEKEVMPAIAGCLEKLFPSHVPADQAGIYLVSANAGFQSSLLFWQQALRQGVAFANPELFPWTLANAPAAWLARHFSIKGPNFTYTGKSSTLVAALHQAKEDLFSNRVLVAWVITLDFAQRQQQRTIVSALRLSTKPSPYGYLCKQDFAVKLTKRQFLASTALNNILEALNSGKEALLTDGNLICHFQREFN